MTDQEGQAGERRRSIRRTRGGGFGSRTGSDSLGTPRHLDDNDLDDEEMERSVINGPVIPDNPPEGDGTGAADPRNVIAALWRQSPAYAKEYRQQLVGRMLMRNVPLYQIAIQLGISTSTAEKDRAAWRKTMAEQARNFDVNEYLGEQMARYDEMSGQALRIALTGDTPVAMRLASMRTAIAANSDKTRTLHAAGVFDAARFRKVSDGSSMSDIQRLMESTAAALQDILSEDTPGPTTPPSSRTKGGFSGMAMDEGNGPEVLEIGS